MSKQKLKCPYPWFGGKSAVASLVWSRLGNVDNFVEPFFGSGAVLLMRPTAPKIETANDLDSMVANFWRATASDPDEVAKYADGPVNEVDLHSRHRWLVLSEDAATFRQRMRTEPDYFDAKVAGYWCWGLCCWIGSGWCTEPGTDWEGRGYGMVNQGVNSAAGGTNGAPSAKGTARENPRPHLGGGEGQYGMGIHAKGEGSAAWNKLPLIGDLPRGVHRGADKELAQKRPRAHRASGDHQGTTGTLPGVNGRPQLADAYSRGRGVNGNDDAGTCAQRLAWLKDWFGRLRDRLRTVRVCCGDWLRVCDSESVTTRLGITGIFFDPPYSAAAGRNNTLYAKESKTVAHDVRTYCLERGSNPLMRIALCGYAGEGHDELEAHGWKVVEWRASGGYGNRSAKGKENAGKERIWFSPHCLNEISLFDSVED